MITELLVMDDSKVYSVSCEHAGKTNSKLEDVSFMKLMYEANYAKFGISLLRPGPHHY